MHTMKEAKKRYGIVTSADLVKRVERIVKDSKYLKTNRSEVIETILETFFMNYQHERDIEKVRSAII